MAPILNMGIPIAAVTLFALAASTTSTMKDGRVEALCGGSRFERSPIPQAALPYLRLSADGVSGQFLVDYGATRSSLSARAFATPEGAVRRASLSLPGFNRGEFDLKQYPSSSSGADEQIGVIGTDFLSLLTVQMTRSAVFLGVQSCAASVLGAQGLIPVSQDSFFSSRLSDIGDGLPNVPIVFLRLGEVSTWAQIDTGYDDRVYPHSVDINEALYDRLVANGVQLDRGADLTVWTCEGRERRRVYSAKGRALTIQNEKGKPILNTELFHLIVKGANGCGGIGALTTPAAQLGASFLPLFRTVVFDPRSRTVWVEGGGVPER